MSLACPACKVPIALKGPKPGTYRPKCPKCAEQFWVVVVAAAAPAAPPAPAADARTSVAASRGPKPAVVGAGVGHADPHATGAFAGGPATGDFTPAGDPHATGDFTDPPAGDPHATGDFTDPAPAGTRAGPPSRGEDDADFSVNDTPEPAAGGDGEAPHRLGGYEVLKVLGRGGMGAVLLGRQLSLDRKVALKVMHPRIASDPTFVARFTREAYAAAQLTHHNVVQIYDIGEDRGTHFFSMEFVPGRSLMDALKADGKLAPDVAVGYVLQAARGLRFGHIQGMVHRDIKPDNLLVNAEGVVKVADMGLVKLPSGELPAAAGSRPAAEDDPDDRPSSLTRAGAVMGTPAYMSPEQATDSASVDARADVYSLGCTLYVLVTGRPVFDGKTTLEILSKHQTEPVVPPEVIVKRVPKALSVILQKMLAKRPDDRYQSMDEVIAALEGFLGVNRSGPFTPKESHADQLEACAADFREASKGPQKRLLVLGFAGACAAGVVGAAVAGSPAVAGGLLGLAAAAPLPYFVVHGLNTGSPVFTRARAVAFGMRLTDWLLGLAGGALFVATLSLFGLLWAWLAFCAAGVGLGFLLWYLTDRPEAEARAEPVSNARILFKQMRLHGLDEDALRQFVCKFSGADWEPFFEALFGYEAKLAARAYRKGNTGEESRAYGAWREPVVAWLDARLEERRLARERKMLLKVEAKALEAEGVSGAAAREQAAAMADALVEQASAALDARRKGEAADLRVLVKALKANRRPQPGFNIAGVPLRKKSPWAGLLTAWVGPRLRAALGAALFAVGLFWLHANGLLVKNSPILRDATNLDVAGLARWFGGSATKPPAIPWVPVEVVAPLNSLAVPLTGFLLLLTGVFFRGWQPSLVAIPGAVVAVLGAMFGIPAVGPVPAEVFALGAGAAAMLVGGWVLRR